MNELTRRVASRCFQMVMSNEVWKDLGFRRRPRYGRLFQRFRRQWKVQLENSLMKEMIAIFSALYFVTEVIDIDQLDELARLYTIGPKEYKGSPLWECYGYRSSTEAIAHLRDSILLYRALPTNDWYGIFCDHCGFFQLPDKKLSGKLLVGGLHFFKTIEAMRINSECLRESVGGKNGANSN